MEEDHPPIMRRIFAALFFGVSSFVIVVANKIVLTSYKFPSYQVLGIGQMITGIVVLFIARQVRILDFPAFSPDIVKRVWPLPLIFCGNLVFGLGGTKKLNLPMFTVLRRFSIVFTMVAEYWILGIQANRLVQFTVFLMMFGAVIAGSTDLAFDLVGYVFILLNDVCTAANVVYTKQKLDAKDLGKYGLLFYNSLIIVLPVSAFALYQGDFQKAYEYTGWLNPWFLIQFILSCVMGFILNYSIVVCTHYNSALTTTIIGVLKNLLVTYLGMVLGGDYIFSWPNFIGLNISVIGSLIYTYVTFTGTQKPKAEPKVPPKANGGVTV